MAHLGFVGLGVMGGRMVKRLLDAGHTATNQMLSAANGMGLAEHDFAVVFEALARMSGLNAP